MNGKCITRHTVRDTLDPIREACPFQNLYPFSTLWAIAFWHLFGYSNTQQESLIGAPQGG
jgi:hypothetical protein